jgi:hypothetical protein
MGHDMTKKIFISQPMRGRTTCEILGERLDAISQIRDYVHYKFGQDIEIIDTFLENFNGNRLEFLGKSILEGLAKADIAVFVGDWQEYDGCCCEHYIAERYGIEVFK